MCTPATTENGDVPNAGQTDMQDATTQFINAYAQLFKDGQRSPILRRPDEYGMQYEDIWFPSLDGTVLQGWFIPCEGSNKLIIANHPMTCNRYGFPGHLDGYGGFGGCEVNFLKDYKALHDAGFNVICYDLRNHGISAQGSGGICGALGLYESRDVVGSIQYALSRSDTKGMIIGLFSRCLGGNSTIVGMSKYPSYFTNIKCVILLQAVSGHAFVEKGAKDSGFDVPATLQKFDTRIHELTGFRLKELTPIPYAKDVKIPALVAQVRKDSLIDTKDTQEIYDALGSSEKELIWIDGTTRRFDGYNYFGDNPSKMLAFSRSLSAREYWANFLQQMLLIEDIVLPAGRFFQWKYKFRFSQSQIFSTLLRPRHSRCR